MSDRVHVETLRHPAKYTFGQMERAKRIAHALGRGTLVLCEPPQR